MLKDKRKVIFISLASLLLIAALVVTVVLLCRRGSEDREVFIYEDFEYVILENGRIEIISYLGDDYEIKIPTAIDQRSVYSIGAGAFRALNVTSVTFGALIEEIGDYAFCNCSMLSSVKIPERLASIGEYAFFGTQISEIHLPDRLTRIGKAAFSHCENLK